MRSLLSLTTCFALGLGAAGLSLDAAAQGPVREGLRETGEAAARGVRAAGEAAVRTGQAAGRVIGRTGQAVARGTAAGVRALTPGVPIQARAGANLTAEQQARDANWRFQQHNGEWWYYNPQGSWQYYRDNQWQDFAADSYELPANMSQPRTQDQQMAQSQQFSQGQQGGQPQPYTSGYRGAQGMAPSGPVYTLHTDGMGREYIIDGGCRRYVTDARAGSQMQQPSLADDPNAPMPPEQYQQQFDQQQIDQQRQQRSTTPQGAGTDPGSAEWDQSDAVPSEPQPSAGVQGSIDADANLGTAESGANTDVNAGAGVDETPVGGAEADVNAATDTSDSR